MLALKQEREHKGWWLGSGWSETDTRFKWGKTLEQWNDLSAIERTYAMA